MKRILVLTFLVFVAMSCNDNDKFIVRLKNETGVKLENVEVSSISGEEKVFGTIENQKYSNYESFNSISRRDQLNAIIDHQHFTNRILIGIWPGHPYDPGHYTYILYDIDTATQSFSLLISDE